MFKVDDSGIPVEVWPPIKLTEEDLETIKEDIINRTSAPTLQKVNGIWVQRTSTDIIGHGHRIYEAHDELCLFDQIGEDMQEAELMKSLASV